MAILALLFLLSTFKEAMEDKFLNQKELASRYKISIRLNNWRSKGYGPNCYLIGGKILYDQQEVKEWENENYKQISN